MRISRHFLTGVAALLLPAACQSAYQPPPPPPARAAVDPRLAQGHAIHQAQCANCHAYVNPAALSVTDLTDDVLPSMARKAKLTAAERDAVLAYLLSVRGS